MEHLSRRTTRDVDYLFVLSEPTPIGVRTASRIIAIANKLGSRIRSMHLVLNKARPDAIPDAITDAVRDIVEDLDVAKVWFLPRSPQMEAAAAGSEKLFGEGVALEGLPAIVDEVRNRTAK